MINGSHAIGFRAHNHWVLAWNIRYNIMESNLVLLVMDRVKLSQVSTIAPHLLRLVLGSQGNCMGLSTHASQSKDHPAIMMYILLVIFQLM